MEKPFSFGLERVRAIGTLSSVAAVKEQVSSVLRSPSGCLAGPPCLSLTQIRRQYVLLDTTNAAFGTGVFLGTAISSLMIPFLAVCLCFCLPVSPNSPLSGSALPAGGPFNHVCKIDLDDMLCRSSPMLARPPSSLWSSWEWRNPVLQSRCVLTLA